MSARERLALDAAILALVVAAANPLATGLEPHDWLGIIVCLPVLLHVILNWDWVARTVTGLFEKARAGTKTNLAIDFLLFLSVVGVSISGGLVIPGFAEALGLPEASGIWHIIHLWTADATVVLSLLHLAMHFGWIAEALGKVAGAKA